MFNKVRHVSTDKIIDIVKRQGYRFSASARFSSVAAATDDEDDITLGDDGYVYNGFLTGDRPVILFGRKIGFTGDGVIAYIYRDPTFVGGTIGGTELTDFRNSNDINAKTSTVTINAGLVADGTTGAISDLGQETFMRQFIIGNSSNQGNGGLIPILDDPLLMPPNKQYILIFKNVNTSNTEDVASHLQWCEPDNIPGLVIQSGEFVIYNGATL